MQFLERTGKDLFDYMRLSIVNQDRANEQALEKFVTIDDKPLETADICRLKVEVRDRLIGSVFSMKNAETFYIDTDIDTAFYVDKNGKEWSVKKLKIKYSLLTEIQTKFSEQSNSKNYSKAMKDALTVMFDITPHEIDKAPYQFIAGLVNTLNSFLTQCTGSENEFEVADDDLFSD